MGFIIGIVVLAVVVKLLSDASISDDCQKRCRKSYEEAQSLVRAGRMEQALKDDVYCTPKLGFTDPTRHFDGTPKE